MLMARDQALGFSEFQKAAFLVFARSHGKVETYEDGETIFDEGDAPACMYVVLAGAVSITSHHRVIETIYEGSTVGILSLLDQQWRTVTAKAAGPCELAGFDRKRFRYMIEEVPNFSLFVMSELAHRLRATNALL